jgi:hypothetical protein
LNHEVLVEEEGKALRIVNTWNKVGYLQWMTIHASRKYLAIESRFRDWHVML